MLKLSFQFPFSEESVTIHSDSIDEITQLEIIQSISEPVTPDTKNEVEQEEAKNDEIEIVYAYTNSNSKHASTFTDLLGVLARNAKIDENTLFQEHGYMQIDVISDITQGNLFKAQVLNNNVCNQQFVTIKKCERRLFEKQMAMKDGINGNVSENIIKEINILKYLSTDHQPMRNFIINYVDSFQSDDAYYLVMEHIESGMNLRRFIDLAFELIEKKQMKGTHYRSYIKYIFWQLIILTKSLHNDSQC